MMRGTNPFVAIGLAGLAGLALIFVAKKATPTATAPAQPGAPPPVQPPAPPLVPGGIPGVPGVPGVGLPQPTGQPAGQPPNLAALQTQLTALLAQVAVAPQTIDPAQLDAFEGELRANGLNAQADQVHAAAAQLRAGRPA